MKWSAQQAYIRKVNLEWERFVSFGRAEGLTIRPDILESWQRCYRDGVSPSLWSAPTVLNAEQLRQERISNRKLLEAASPIMKELGQLLYGTGQMLVLCNAKAVVMDTVGDRAAISDAANVNLQPGAGIGESDHGTTGVSLVMATRRPASILATEHYCSGPKEWAAVSAPIHYPNSSELVGIFSLAGRYMLVNNHSAGMIISAARVIEGQLQEQYLRRRGALLTAYKETVLRRRADLVLAIDTGMEVADASVIGHPLLIGHPPDVTLTRDMERGVREIMAAPSLATRVDNVELPGKGSYTITYSPVFMDQDLCGILLYVYGPRDQGIRRPVTVARKNKTTVAFNAPRTGDFGGMVGVSAAFNRVFELGRRVAATDATVVIIGETGVGKEGLARAIHQWSPRRQGPFIAVNCGAIPKELIAGELFGSVPGAFTGASPHGNVGKIEAADGGTLLLDEIGEMSPETQTYLLRVLQEKEVVRLGSHKPTLVDVRVITATHADLRQLVREGRFREDLYYRLSVVEILVPPLRERVEDFPHLIAHFLGGYGIAHGIALGEKTLRAISGYTWPGNVRELMNVVQRAVVLGQDIQATLLDYVRSQGDIAAGNSKTLEGTTDPVMRTVLSTAGNVAQAARELGVARSTIYRHLKHQKMHINRSLTSED